LTGSKKNLDFTVEQKRKAIEPGHKKVPIYRQCELLSFSRSGLYYKRKGETEYNELLMKLIDKQYIETPFYGIDKMTEWLGRQGHPVNHKRVRRLMRQMGLEAVYPRRRRSLSITDSQRCADNPARSSLVGRYNLCPDVSRMALSCSCYGLVQSLCSGLGNIGNIGG